NVSNPFLFSVSEAHPQAVLTLQPAWSQIFPGETVTLSCYTTTRVAFYKDNKELQYRTGTELSVDRVSKSDEGSYRCRAWWWDTASWTESWSDSAEVRVSVRERPQAVLTQEPAWTQIYESERVTLRCQVQGGYTDWRFTWYKAGRNAPVTQDYYSSIDGDRYTISSATGDHSGEYTCKGERRGNPSYSKTSDALTLRVSELFSTPTLTVLPGASVWEGEAVTLQCGAHINKQGTQLQYRYSKDNGTVRGAGSQDQHSIPAAGLRDTGRYQCEVEAAGTGLKKRSASVSLTVRALFSRMSLTASPGATVKEGEALNLTCEAAVNKTPALNSTTPFAAAAAGFSVGFFVILLIVFTLLLLYHKIRGFPCITGGKRRECSDQNQDQAAGGVELSSRAQQPDSEDIVYSEIDTSKHNNTKKVKPAETDTVYSAVKISAGKPTADNAESMYATVLPMKKRK
ncbi:Fc receptor-like protein 5, partial [Huso huso]